MPRLRETQRRHRRPERPQPQLQTSSTSTPQPKINSTPSVGDKYAQKITDGRPYRTKRDLGTRKIIPAATYEKIKDQIIAHQATANKNSTKH